MPSKPKLSRGGRAGRTIDWPQFDSLLPYLSNLQAAKLIGCSDVAVLKRRAKIGLPPWNATDAARLIAARSRRK